MEDAQTFIPIDLYVPRVDKVHPFDIFLRNEIGRKDHTLLSGKGSRFTGKVRQKLLLNRVKTLYVSEAERDTYQQYAEDNLHHIITDKLVAPERKSEVVYDAVKHVMKKLFEDPRAEIFSRTKNTVNHVISLMVSDRKAAGHLIRITDYDYSTHTHSVNVGIFSTAFARKLMPDVSNEKLYELGLGFFLHDIGKAVLPLEILQKPGSLSDEEWKIMKTHPEKGYKILDETGFLSKASAAVVLEHHERESGAGYPKGLKGDRIHPVAKICSMADMFDAMTTKRCYKEACTAFDCLDLLKEKMLCQEFDQNLFEKFVGIFSPREQ